MKCLNRIAAVGLRVAIALMAVATLPMLAACITPTQYDIESDPAAIVLAEQGLVFAEDMRRPNPEARQAAEAGELDMVSAAWWGFDADDATEMLQAALDSGAAEVIIPNMNRPWNATTIQLRSNQRVLFERGAVLQAKRGEFLDKGAALLAGSDVENVTLMGYGATVRMWREDYIIGCNTLYEAVIRAESAYKGPCYPSSQWRHALSLRTVQNVEVAGLRFESSGGDGIYLGRTSSGSTNKRVRIRDVVTTDHHRQGISVVTAIDLGIENSWLVNTVSHPPRSGIDFEPNNPNDRLTEIVVSNVRLIGNAGHGLYVELQMLDAGSDKVEIRVEDSQIGDNGLFGVVIHAPPGVRGQIELVNNRNDNTADLISAPDLEITQTD